VAAAIWACLLAGVRCLAAGPGAGRRRWRLCFRVIAVCVAVALCSAGLVAAPARTALAAAIDPVNPGGDLTISMPFHGASSTFMSQVASTTYPAFLGVPTDSPLSTLMAASASQDSGSGSGAAPPPTTCNCGTISVSTVTQTVTETMPASSVPASNVPSGPRGPLASFLSAAITNLVKLTALGICLFYNGYRMGGTQPIQPPPALSTVQALVCGTWADMFANITTYSLNDLWSGMAPTGAEWAKIFTFAATNVGAAFLTAKYAAPWMLQYITGFGSVIVGAIQVLFNGAEPWLGPAPGDVNATATAAETAFDFVTDISQQATTATINAVFAANGLPTVVAEGNVVDTALGSPAYQCMDAWQASGLPVDHDPVAINLCNSSADENWIVWSNNTLSNGGLCLDVTGANWRSNAPLELDQCDGQGIQRWVQDWMFFGSRPVIYNTGVGWCVDDPNWNTDPGTQLKDAPCTSTTAQQWLMPGNTTGPDTFPVVTNYGPVDSGLSGECMDAYGSSDGASPGQIVAINACNGGLSQDWTVWSDGTVRVWTMCMDTSGSGVGALVELEDCDGAVSQDWTQQSNGSLKDSASGLCLEDPGATTTAGTQLDLDTCNGATDEQWALPAPPPDQTPPPPTGNGSVCDLYAYYGTPCVGAYSMTRALYASYDGPLYRVQRASDGTTANIGLLAAGADVNAAGQDSFCANTSCTITEIFDQSSEGNNLTIEQGGGAAPAADQGAVANALPVKIGGHEAYGLDIEPGTGYRDDRTAGVATGSEAEGMYMVASGTHVNSLCCYDFGNVESNNDDNNVGHMDAVNLTTWCGGNSSPCNGSGPWVEADLENGQWMGNGPNPADTGNSSSYVTAMLKNNGTDTFELEGGDSASGGLTTWYDGALPSQYQPMKKEGAIVLGTGGDNSNSDIGSFFEGVMTAGYPSDAADAAVQANIVAAGYSGNTNPASTVAASASAAGQAVVHDGYSSVYTVDSASGDLQESYLPAMGDAWSTQDLSTEFGTPPVMPGTEPVSVFHCGFTSVYTVDEASGDLQETYLPAAGFPGDRWLTQDLSANYGTPPTNATPTAVVHDAGASGASGSCGYTSVYTRDRTGDLQETYLSNTGFPGDPWVTQDLSANYGTPQILAGTSPVAIVHCGFTSVYTVDAANHNLQETYLPAIGGAWTSQDLSANYGTPDTTTTPTAAVHTAGAAGASPGCGYTSVYTVDQSSQDLQETFLPNAGFPGDAWQTQDLSAKYGTPPVAPGTRPQALVHMNYTSVYTTDQGSDQVQETYLPAIGGPWTTQSLSANYGTPVTDQSPIVLLHQDTGGVLDWASVFTIGEFSAHLQETYLPNAGFPGDPWVTQDLSAKYGTPPVYVQQSSQASWSVAHDGYTSAYTVDASSGHLDESYLTAMGKPWAAQDLSAKYGTPKVRAGTVPVALTHDGYTSVYTVDAANRDLRETYLPAIGGPWYTQDLSAGYGAPQVAAGSSPAAVFHDGYASVYTVDAVSGDLQETYLPAAGFPGDPWQTQNLTNRYGTPAVMTGTSPVAIVHDGYTSVYTVDAVSGDLQETYLPFMGGAWSTQDLSAKYGTPKTEVTPAAVFHNGYTSVYTVGNQGDLQETFLPAIGDPWTTQDLTANYGVPKSLNIAPAALYHDGYTSVYYLTGPDDDLAEAYLPAISGPWHSQDLSASFGTPPSVQGPSPLVHYDTSGGLTWPSVYTIDSSSGHLQETYLPDAGFPGDPWQTQDLSAKYLTPAGDPPGSVMYSPSSGNEYLGYARMIRLGYAGPANGTLLATFEHEAGNGAISDYEIQKSTDDGATWSNLSTVAGDAKSLAPFLFEYPKQFGRYPAGTLMLLGNTRSASDTGAAIREWLSFDHGASWTYAGVVQSSPGGPGDGVWEPFVTVDSSGNLAMFFSDERQHATYSQLIGEVISTDGGLTWSANPDGSASFGPGEIKVVASPFPADRPGMATVAQIGFANGYMLSYEMCGPQACNVHTKTSADGDNWGSGPADLGTLAETGDGLVLQGTPVITWVFNGGPAGGTLYLSGRQEASVSGSVPQNQPLILTNTNGGNGPWSWIPAPAIPTAGAASGCNTNYSPDLLVSADPTAPYYTALHYTVAAAAGPRNCEEITASVPIAP
jgi:hypothetical protein